MNPKYLRQFVKPPILSLVQGVFRRPITPRSLNILKRARASDAFPEVYTGK
jgi:hypothetical protein